MHLGLLSVFSHHAAAEIILVTTSSVMRRAVLSRSPTAAAPPMLLLLLLPLPGMLLPLPGLLRHLLPLPSPLPSPLPLSLLLLSPCLLPDHPALAAAAACTATGVMRKLAAAGLAVQVRAAPQYIVYVAVID